MIYNPADFHRVWSALSEPERTRVIALARQRSGIPERINGAVVGSHEFGESSLVLMAAVKAVLIQEMAGEVVS